MKPTDIIKHQFSYRFLIDKSTELPLIKKLQYIFDKRTVESPSTDERAGECKSAAIKRQNPPSTAWRVCASERASERE